MNKNGGALVLVIFLMIMCSLVAATAFSILAVDLAGSMFQSIQASAIAVGGKEWYLEQLENDNDWSDEADQTGIALGFGTFDITVNSASAKTVSFTVTGRTAGSLDQPSQNQVSQSVRRLPAAAHFALYAGRDTGTALSLRNTTTINGDMWSRGSVDVQSGTAVTGVSYCPDIESVTGAGSFTEKTIGAPYPAMPQINEAPYNSLISTFDGIIDADSSNSTCVQSTDLVLNGNTIECRHFRTTGNITISGNGYIVANRNIDLHSRTRNPDASGTLTVTPSGGNIYFLAGRNLTVNSTDIDTNVDIQAGTGGTYLYARSETNTNQLLTVRENNGATSTTIDGAFIMGKIRILVSDGAQITNSTLYVSDQADANNYLRVMDSGTVVGTPGNPCLLISVSGRNPGMMINTGASVTGLVYHWGDTTGYTTINTATITGSVIASQYTNDRIANSTITYSEADVVIPDSGFENTVSVDLDSWNDY